MAHIKEAKTVSLIHDLGCFRRKKLTIEQELKRLNHTDYVIATNEAMKEWLEQQGFKKPVGALGFHDYLSPSIVSDKSTHLTSHGTSYMPAHSIFAKRLYPEDERAGLPVQIPSLR